MDDDDGPDLVTIVLVAAAVMLVTVGVAGTAWWAAGRPTSEYPDWIAAGATLAAVGAAIVAGAYAARAFGLEHERQVRFEQQQFAAQASLVSAWPAGPARMAAQDRAFYVTGATAWIRNASPLPVSNVSMTFHLVEVDADGYGHKMTKLGTTRVAYVPPSEEPNAVDLELSGTDRTTLPAKTELDAWELRVEMWFHDAGGMVWHRGTRGALDFGYD